MATYAQIQKQIAQLQQQADKVRDAELAHARNNESPISEQPIRRDESATPVHAH